jgi:hypothetical protein
LEETFIDYTNAHLTKHQMLPKYCEIKLFFDRIAAKYPTFKASKGWYEKFVWRNYRAAPRIRYKKIRRVGEDSLEDRSATGEEPTKRKSCLRQVTGEFPRSTLAPRSVTFDLKGSERKRSSFQPFHSIMAASRTPKPNACAPQSSENRHCTLLHLSEMTEDDIIRSINFSGESKAQGNPGLGSTNTFRNMRAGVEESIDTDVNYKSSILRPAFDHNYP